MSAQLVGVDGGLGSGRGLHRLGCRRLPHRLHALDGRGLVRLRRGLIHLLGPVHSAHLLRVHPPPALALRHLLDHHGRPALPVAPAGGVVGEGDADDERMRSLLRVDAGPAAQKGLPQVGEEGGAGHLRHAALAVGHDDPALYAVVVVVRAGDLVEDVVARDDGGLEVPRLLVPETDQVRVLRADGVELVSLAEREEEGHVARGCLWAHQVAHLLLAELDHLAVVGLELHDLATHGAPLPRT